GSCDSSPLSLHDALPIFDDSYTAECRMHRAAFVACVFLFHGAETMDRSTQRRNARNYASIAGRWPLAGVAHNLLTGVRPERTTRSEEHTSELQSRENLVC